MDFQLKLFWTWQTISAGQSDRLRRQLQRPTTVAGSNLGHGRHFSSGRQLSGERGRHPRPTEHGSGEGGGNWNSANPLPTTHYVKGGGKSARITLACVVSVLRVRNMTIREKGPGPYLKGFGGGGQLAFLN